MAETLGRATQIPGFTDNKWNMPENKLFDMYRLKKLSTRMTTDSSQARNISTAIHTICNITSTLNLPRHITEEALVTYKRALKLGIIRGRRIIEVAAACVYCACRVHKQPRSIQEVAESTGIDPRSLASNYRTILKRMPINTPVHGIEPHIARIVGNLGLPGQVEMTAKDILNMCLDKRITAGKGPSGMAAAMVYISCRIHNHPITQREISRICSITDVTLRNRYQDILKQVPELKERIHKLRIDRRRIDR